MNILELMEVAPPGRDLAWLKEALQAAVELEFATIPPYLAAMWSVKDPGNEVYDLLNGIVLEEMGHMGLAANMLNAVGGTPAVNTAAAVPKYPGPLPGGVRPGLIVSLAGLTLDRVRDVFMEIEFPQGGPIAFDLGMTFPTIGAFYDAILAAFHGLPSGSVTGQRQLKSPSVGLFPVHDLADVERAVKQIKQQGEGTTQGPFGDPDSTELAHYYRFAEIYHGRKLIAVGGKFKYEGDPLPFPDVYPMAPVPPEGYPTESKQFDEAYTSLLDTLQGAFAAGAQAKLQAAVSAMYGLGELAVALMKKPLPGGTGTYGPDFRRLG
jgi:hypothetical protein